MAPAIEDLQDRERAARWRREFSDGVQELAWLALAVGAVSVAVDLVFWPWVARATEKPDVFVVLWPLTRDLMTYAGLASWIVALKVVGMGALGIAFVWTDGFDRGPANVETGTCVGAAAMILVAVPQVIAFVLVAFNVVLWIVWGLCLLALVLLFFWMIYGPDQ